MMKSHATPPGAFAFGDYELDGARYELRRRGVVVRVEPKVLALLLLLVRHRERVVQRDEILEALWPGTHVSDAALGYCVKAARKAIGDDGTSQTKIATVQRRGYRFVAEATAREVVARAPHGADGAVTDRGTPAGGFFVGREAVMARLRGALVGTRAGRGRVVLLSGEPGIGKTRTAEELARVAADDGFDVLIGRCHEGFGAPPFWPWVQILRAYVARHGREAALASMGAFATDLAALLPDLAPEARTAALSKPEQEDARLRLFGGAIAFFPRAAASRPLVLVLDDLHWADTPSLLLLQLLAHEISQTPLLLVGTFRDTEVPASRPLGACVADVTRIDATERIQLEGLKPEDLGRLLEAATGERPLPPLVHAVYEQTGGNPLFVTETVRLLASESQGRGFAHARRVPVPRTVRETVTRRVEALSAPARDLLHAAAVIGRELDLAVVARMRGAERGEKRRRLLDGLDEAVRARLIEPHGATGGFRFSHALVREALYDALPSGERIALHEAAGSAIATAHAADPGPYLASLAHHFGAAALGGDTGPAVDYAIRAGDRAADLLAYEEAAAHYRQALDLLERGEPSTGRRARSKASPRRSVDDLLLLLGENLWKAGDLDDARAAYRRAADRARDAQSASGFATAALGFGGGFRGFDLGVVEPELIALLEEALRRLPASAHALRARVMARLAVALYHVPQSIERRQALSAEAVRVAEKTRDGATQIAALYSRHWAIWGPDTLDERKQAAAAMLRLAERIGDREAALHAHRFRLIDALESGDLATIDSDLAHCQRLAEELRQPYYRWYALQLRAMRSLLAGRVAESERETEEARAAGRRAQSRNVDQIYYSQLFWIRRAQGRLAELEPPLRAVIAQYPALPSWRGGLAFVLSELGRASEAREHFEILAADDFAGVSRSAFWLTAIVLAADTCATLGDVARARVLHGILSPYAGRMAEVLGGSCLGSVDRPLGRLAAVIGERRIATAHFASALAAERRLEAPLLVARTERDRDTALAAMPREPGRRPSPAAASRRRGVRARDGRARS